MGDDDIELVHGVLLDLGDPVIAAHSLRFFKTGPGEYGEGDRFLGIRVPVIRKQVGRFAHLDSRQLAELLISEWHEVRLFALLALVRRYERGTALERESIYQLYLSNTQRINNWDLVDSSAAGIVGAHLSDRNRQPLYDLATSDLLWERRIAIIATLHFIRQEQFGDTLAISERLLGDQQDLIHKACGWMLREVGKRDVAVVRRFLDRHVQSMPRTMLRYAIERFPAEERRRYLESRRA